MGKTGAMICASVQLGCLAAGISPSSDVGEKLTAFAQKIGLVFQIIDDILDVTSTDFELGKNTGSDADKNKTTFMTFFGVEEAKQYADHLTVEAIGEIEDLKSSERLIEFAKFLCDRKK